MKSIRRMGDLRVAKLWRYAKRFHRFWHTLNVIGPPGNPQFALRLAFFSDGNRGQSGAPSPKWPSIREALALQNNFIFNPTLLLTLASSDRRIN